MLARVASHTLAAATLMAAGVGTATVVTSGAEGGTSSSGSGASTGSVPSSSATSSTTSNSNATGTTAPRTVTFTPVVRTKTLPFGYSRSPKPLTLIYKTTTPINADRGVDVVVGDLTGKSDSIPSAQVSMRKTIPAGGSLLEFTLVVDPKDAAGGSYSGTAQITGDKITGPPVPLTATLSAQGDGMKALVFVVTFIGTLIGLGLRFVAGTGKKLERVRTELASLERDFGLFNQRHYLPPDVAMRMDRVRDDLAAGLADEAATELQPLLDHREELIQVARWYGWVESTATELRGMIEESFTGAWKPRLSEVADEAQRHAGLVRDGSSSSDPAATGPERRALTEGLEGYGEFLHVFREADETKRTQGRLAEALALYRAGPSKYAEAKEKWVGATDEAAPAVSKPKGVGPAANVALLQDTRLGRVYRLRHIGGGRFALERPPSPGRRLRDLVDRHAGWVLAIGAGLAVGFWQVHHAGNTFHGLDDWLQFFAIGVGTGLAGVTAGELLGRATGTPPAAG